MAKFTIETTFRLPVYRQRTYEADSFAEACQRAIEDDDWSAQKHDYDSSGPTHVTGAWEGAGTAYAAPALPIPGQFREPLQRRADLFEVMLGMLKILAYADDLQAPNLPTRLPRAQAIIAKAEAVLAKAPDPDSGSTGRAGAAYIVLELRVDRVRQVIGSILETDPDLSEIPVQAVSDKDILLACTTVSTRMDLAERIEGAEFRAALMAIGIAEAHPVGPDHG